VAWGRKGEGRQVMSEKTRRLLRTERAREDIVVKTLVGKVREGGEEGVREDENYLSFLRDCRI